MTYSHKTSPLAARFAVGMLSSALWLLPLASMAQTRDFVIRDIRVEGLQRTEAGTVFSYLPVKVGDTFSDRSATDSIKALFATGFFKDVRIEAEGDVLVVIVEERPAIGELEINGAKEFDKDTLKKALKEIGLSESKIFDRALLERAEQELKRQYLSRGKYSAEIKTTVTPIERNRVRVVLDIKEGESATIKTIRVLGAKAFPEKELLGQFELNTGGLFSFFSKSNRYSRQKLAGDLEKLRSYYLNNGYMEFNIDSTQVQISPSKEDVYITINVNEGDRFTVGSVKLAGDLLGKDAEFNKLLTIKPGETYNGQLLSDVQKAISDRMGAFGYAFANVNAAPDINREKRSVDFTLYVDPGRRVYVRRINIGGNTRTKDEVVRRELRQFESSWYDAEKIRLSKDRLNRLGYFKDVNVDTPPVEGTADQIDVNVAVTEKPTGNLLLGAGFSSTDKLILSAGIQQQNLFGTGKTLGLELNTSRLSRTVAISQTDPYFTADGISRSYDLFQRTTNPAVLGLGDYKLTSTGAGIRFGYPLSEFERITFGTSYEQTDLSVGQFAPTRFKRFVEDFGESSDAVLVSVGYGRDNRDSALTPTRGFLRRLNTEVTLPVAEQRFIRTTFQETHYFPIGKNYTLGLNGELTIGSGIGGNPYPIFRNVFAGGIGSIRGFQTASIGPRDENGIPIGGSKRIIGNAEFYFPIPGSFDKSFRLFTFLDAGNVFPSSEPLSLSGLRASYGLGLSWVSPVGPLKFSLGRPISAKPGDRTQTIQFTVGTGF